MYSPKVAEYVEAAKLRLPELNQVELFKQYFETANPHIRKVMYEPNEEIPEKSKYFTGYNRDYIEKLVSPENHRIQFFTFQGELFINTGDNKLIVEFKHQATINGIFIKNSYLAEVDGFMYSDSSKLIDNLDSHSDLYTPFQTFLENMIFKSTKVKLPEKLVCLPHLQWSESTFTFKFVGNYYCLESEVESEGSKAVIKFSR
jgi:hypothetical protein